MVAAWRSKRHSAAQASAVAGRLRGAAGPRPGRVRDGRRMGGVGKVGAPGHVPDAEPACGQDTQAGSGGNGAENGSRGMFYVVGQFPRVRRGSWLRMCRIMSRRKSLRHMAFRNLRRTDFCAGDARTDPLVRSELGSTEPMPCGSPQARAPAAAPRALPEGFRATAAAHKRPYKRNRGVCRNPMILRRFCSHAPLRARTQALPAAAAEAWAGPWAVPPPCRA